MIEIKNFKLKFTKEYYALYNINLEVKEGERVALVGDSESGKTTLLRAIARLEEKDGGQILLRQKPLEQVDFAKDIQVGYVGAKGVFFEKKSVWENLFFVLKIRHTDLTQANIKINEVLREYNIENLQMQKLKSLSDYQRLLVQFARLSLRKIELYLIDNVFDKLTKEEQEEIIHHILNWQKQKATFMIACTKDEIAKRLAAKKILLKLGSIEQQE